MKLFPKEQTFHFSPASSTYKKKMSIQQVMSCKPHSASRKQEAASSNE